MTATQDSPKGKLKKTHFKSDQEVRWCPGCGDYGILNAVQATFADLGLERENTVIVSGIGCSSRFPYYMETYGFHSIHGRAPAVASGVKISRPELEVWVITGDGDALSIGGNHLIHCLRRNVGLKIILFNNRIYGLTKGQFSPTSEIGKVTKSSPFGSVDMPFNPISLALGVGATFVARTIDVMGKHMKEVLKAAHEHEGTAFIEVFQDCNIFNHGAFDPVVKKEIRDDRLVELRANEPLVFGKEHDKGLAWDCNRLRVVKLGEADESGKVWNKEDLVVFDPTNPNPTIAFALSHLREVEEPTPIGVLRSIRQAPYEKMVHGQIQGIQDKKGQRSLEDLIYAGKTWEVK